MVLAVLMLTTVGFSCAASSTKSGSIALADAPPAARNMRLSASAIGFSSRREIVSIPTSKMGIRKKVPTRTGFVNRDELLGIQRQRHRRKLRPVGRKGWYALRSGPQFKGLLHNGETDGELAPLAEPACHFDLPAMGGGKRLHQRQAEPAPSAGTVAGFVDAIKPVKNIGEVFLGNPHAGIDHGNSRLPAHTRQDQADFPPRLVILHPVFQQVEENLPEPHP